MKSGGFFLLVIRVLLGALFLFSAYNKLRPGDASLPSGPARDITSGPFLFALSIEKFELLPQQLIVPATYAIPWAEAVCGAALILGIWGRAAALTLAGLVASFTGAIIIVINRPGPTPTCGCFGKYKLFCEGPIGWCKVGENSLILVMLLVVVVSGAGWCALTDRPRKAAPPSPKPD